MKRLGRNPILTPRDVKPTRDDLTVLCTLNPAAVRFAGQTLLLVRVGEAAPARAGFVGVLRHDAGAAGVQVRHIPIGDPALDRSDPRRLVYRGRTLLTSMSHLRLARSRDGVNFTFDPQPAVFPSTPYESFGCEDPRITLIDGVYYVAYTAVSEMGVAVALASTEDFRTFRGHGIIFPPYQKDVCIFPEKVGGAYICRHRPYLSEFNDACIWTAWSPDLLCWGRHEMTLAPTPGTWEAGRVGAGAPPIRTSEGWLEIYHAADEAGRYCLGAMLSDLDEPQRVLSRSSRPVLEPRADYELAGLYANCVFCNGLVVDEGGAMTVYYGAADRICAAALTSVDEMIAAAKS